ncbi:MAG: hypothetical protein AAFP98_05825, partial [Pseudomonadota bacterium]
FWPPFAVAIAGGVLFSTIVSFYFTPPVFALIHRRTKPTSTFEDATFEDADDPVTIRQIPLKIAAE